jgi:hypothetical protein
MNSAVAILTTAKAMHAAISRRGLELKDNTNAYQAEWATAGRRLLSENAAEFEYLEMIGGP